MHHKFYFILAGIFLAVAFIVPTVAFILQAQRDSDDIWNIINNPSQGTGPNTTLVDPDQVNENHSNTIILVMVVDVVFVSLFIIMIYLGINHYHGQYDKPKGTGV
jgi:hypothetical protein